MIHVYKQMEKMEFESITETILCQSIIKRLVDIGFPLDAIGVDELRKLMDLYMNTKPRHYFFPMRE